jgi:2-polyprenyl-6-methoxyphenol hydroxylase-like FAD-dependent oxidoreductase
MRPVLLAGGGIGGLTTAIALARAGLDSHVLERSTFAAESGAGIQLGPNATGRLRDLGVLDMLMSAAFRPEAVWLFDGLTGRRLATVPLGDTAERRYGAPYLALHRADLHAGLLAAAEASASISLSSGFEVAGIESRDAGVAVANVDGTTVEGPSLIGADGVWSAVRNWVAPDAALSFTGATAYRALLPRDSVPDHFTAPIVGLWLGPDAHLVHYPVRAGGSLNIVVVTGGGAEHKGWNRAADRASLLSNFTRWCKRSKSLLEQAEAWRAWSLFSLPALTQWSRMSVSLLGDAAHPLLPYLAQGAGLAIEDATAIARCLAATPHDPAQAFSAYETERRIRAAQLQQAARRFGWIYHLRGPARHVRNAGLRFRHDGATLRQFDWLYGAPIRR